MVVIVQKEELALTNCVLQIQDVTCGLKLPAFSATKRCNSLEKHSIIMSQR